jgi:hypothetical protein
MGKRYNSFMDIKRLTTRPDGRRIAFSTHLFFYISLIFGLAFVLPPDLLEMTTSPLYQFTASSGWAFWWGMSLLIVTVANTVMLLTRSTKLASVVGVFGFCLWLFAFFAYWFMGFWFGLFAAAVPSLAFWAWYSFMISRFRGYPEED